MSFARFGWDDSDVYLFPTTEGYECCACPMGEYRSPTALFPTSFVTDDIEAYLAHLAEHRSKGHIVPDDVEEQVREWEAADR